MNRTLQAPAKTVPALVAIDTLTSTQTDSATCSTPATTAPGGIRSWFGRLRRPVTLAASTLAVGGMVLSGLAAAPAASADPSVKSSGGQAEMTRYWSSAFARPMDTGAVATFGGGVASDCQEGLLKAMTAVVSSQEFAGRYRTDIDRTRALYRVILNREGEEAGVVQHATSMYRGGRSLTQVAMTMAASQEGRAQLLRSCAGQRSSNAAVLDSAGTQNRIDQVSNAAFANLVGCLGPKAVTKVAGKVRIGGLPVGQAAAFAGKQALNAAGQNSICRAAAQQLTVIAYMESLSSRGEAVYSRAVSWWQVCDLHTTFQAGASPLDYRQAETSERFFGLACIH